MVVQRVLYFCVLISGHWDRIIPESGEERLNMLMVVVICVGSVSKSSADTGAKMLNRSPHGVLILIDESIGV